MAKTQTSRKTTPKTQGTPSFIGFFKKKETHIVSGILLLMFVTYLFIILVSFLFSGDADQSKVNLLSFSNLGTIDGKTSNIGGAFGAWASNIIINKWFGVSSFFMILFGVILGLRMIGATKTSIIKYFLICGFGLIWTSLFLGFFFKSFYEDSFLFLGGAHGYYLGQWLIDRIGWPGAFLVIVTTLLIFLIIARASTLPFLQRLFGGRSDERNKAEAIEEPGMQEGEFPDEFEQSWTGVDEVVADAKSSRFSKKPLIGDDDEEEEDEEEEDEREQEVLSTVKTKLRTQPATGKDIDFEVKVGQAEEIEEIEEPEIIHAPNHIRGNNEDGYDASYMGDYDPKLDLSSYKYPGINLLTKYESTDTIINKEEQNSNKRRIQEVLEQFGIRISSITATVGATVTLYEIIPEPGVRISRIKSLENDIA